MNTASKSILAVGACFCISFVGFFGLREWGAEKKEPAHAAAAMPEKQPAVEPPVEQVRATSPSSTPTGTAEGPRNETQPRISVPSRQPPAKREPSYQNRSLSSWIAQLRSSDPKSRLAALEAIFTIGEEASPAIPTLIELLPDNQVSGGVVAALVAIGKKAIPELAIALKSSDLEVSSSALVALEGIGTPAVPTITGAVGEGNWKSLRVVAVQCLRRMGPKAKDAVPALTKNLRDEDVQIAAESSVALIRIGKAAIPTLERTLANEKDLIVIVRVVATLRRLGDDAVPVLVKATRQANPTVRTLANDALESMAKEKR